ncbi:NAD(+) diphosphatase [Agrobacterium larrymoorei]|uniref:NAD(+) diphosphatase n=1 Tax=Agrobacterium larrymoorei TaxID=160699 RepID=A0A4D7DXQ2_9HYPH|nr:NAD(+) diphosphatase [Agrobacterium larrymoorei]QCI96510.1 NAD(+) diphosphatase [Agrobacterium larrymoorei]QYA08069.1 NAD(+) diphosphatase [Agrobacterium larrymoorei]
MISKSIFETNSPHPEPSTLTAFAQNGLNRLAEKRDENCVVDALKVEGTHLLAFAGNKLVLKHDDQVLDPLFSAYELAELDPDFERAILLGHKENGEPRVAVPVGVAEDALASHYKPVDARSLYRDQLIGEELLGEVAQAVSLVNWNADNRFCGRCGGHMELRIGGYKRICASCGHTIFPRTDPVVIMLTIDLERELCLLGRGAHFAPGMYSCLAGFVEPGETIENAVRRETREESSIEIGRVRYHASQPWPMPHTLMIGCYSEALSFDITRDEAELEDCRWFTRDEVVEMLNASAANGKSPPPRGAIAHRLMRDWIEWDGVR